MIATVFWASDKAIRIDYFTDQVSLIRYYYTFVFSKLSAWKPLEEWIELNWSELKVALVKIEKGETSWGNLV